MNNFNHSYIGRRDDILNLIPENVSKVLDIGCSVGTLGEQIKQKSGSKVIGIELNKQAAKLAKKKLDKVIIEDLNKINLEKHFKAKYFDCIIFGDVLEHLKDPWSILKQSTTYLNKDGIVIASIPNVRHFTTIINLLFNGYWPYRERGIHDKTHLRFFTLNNIKELFKDANLKITKIKRNYRIIEKPHRINKISKYFSYLPFRELLVFQYIIIASKNKNQ